MNKAFHIMSDKEIDRLEVVQKTEAKLLKRKEAAKLLGITTRQVIRLVKTYRRCGAAGLISKQRGKTSNHKHSDSFKQQVIAVVKSEYADFGPTFAAEKLLENHPLNINKETLRQWMMEADLWKGKQRQTNTVHQQRARRSCYGELVQIDGSDHAWFEDRGPRCCLLVFVDDATSRLLQLRFEETETAKGYFNAVRDYIKRCGRPVAFYNDRHGIFRVNIKEAAGGTGETQFGRAMRELGIEIICANSSQAKGRVERMNGILQDRLVKELRLANINNIEAGNAYLPQFMEKHNQQFAIEPSNPVDAHQKSMPSDEVLDLILTFQSIRTLSKNLELSYQNVNYQIQTQSHGYRLRRAKVTVCDDQQGQVAIIYKEKRLDYKVLDKQNRAAAITDSKQLNEKIEKVIEGDNSAKGHKPKADHPWKRYAKIAVKRKRMLQS